eukprot:TRINITY_DN973_c0_g1_i1.p1 TRINITY_DN973_c0_g1~~TRINITY_DN973_c0_g1_i1.p1  ORF type:complete len:101 (+),score=31.59 TRINITY_DN973_c0_g1_i1:116-418(+)
MSRRFLPLFDRVLVERISNAPKTISGIVLPESAISKSNQARVIAVGAGRHDDNGKTIPLTVKEGDVVVVPESYMATPIKHNDKDMELYRESELLAIISDA